MVRNRAHRTVGARRQRYWLPIAKHFHIPPWDLERLTYAEFMSLCAACDELAKEG